MSCTNHQKSKLNDPPLLQVENLTKAFSEKIVLDRVSLNVEAGDVLAIIGASGSGKSTLLRCLNALEEYQSGKVYLQGACLSYEGEGPKRRRLGDLLLSKERSRVGMVFQSYNLFPHLSARDNITLGLKRVRNLTQRQANVIALDWLERVGLRHVCDYYPHQLSGGQQQRVALARAVALEPELILLDEVTSALDPELVGEVLGVIRDLAASGMTMIVVSHEMAFVRQVASNVTFMKDGRVVEQGSPRKIFEQPESPALRSFVQRSQCGPGEWIGNSAQRVVA